MFQCAYFYILLKIRDKKSEKKRPFTGRLKKFMCIC
jgi:hypothetical protein